MKEAIKTATDYLGDISLKSNLNLAGGIDLEITNSTFPKKIGSNYSVEMGQLNGLNGPFLYNKEPAMSAYLVDHETSISDFNNTIQNNHAYHNQVPAQSTVNLTNSIFAEYLPHQSLITPEAPSREFLQQTYTVRILFLI